MMQPQDTTIPLGLCQCGCGQATNLARQTTRALGQVVGQPMRYLPFHHVRGRQARPLDSYHRLPLADRFWPKVQKMATDWLWTAALDRAGYGKLGAGGRGAPLKAHTVAWFLATGEWPTGEVCHTCDIPACVRNDEPGVYVVDGIECPRMGHLFLASRLLNARDASAKGRLSIPHARGWRRDGLRGPKLM